MRYKFLFLFCILALYLVVWYQKPSSKSEYLGNGITKTTITRGNIVSEDFSSNSQTMHFEITYNMKKPSQVLYHNLYDLPKYKKFLSLIAEITGFTQNEIHKQVQEALALAKENPKQHFVITPEIIKNPWELSWKVSQDLQEPGDEKDNILQYFSIIGQKHTNTND